MRSKQPDSSYRFTARLILLLLGALLVRAGWGLRQPSDDQALRLLPDQHEYLELGRNLIQARSLKFHDARFDADVFAYRTPGYPALIAVCRGSVRVVRFVQALLDTSSVLACWLLARRWLCERGSFFAAAIIAVNPFLIYFSGLILSETLFVAMLAWGLVLLVSSPAKLAGILLLALSVLVRPSAIALPLLCGLAAPLTGCKLRARLRLGAGGAALTLLALLPWAMRNRAVLGERVWTTTNAGITSYDGFNPAADGSSNQRFVNSMPELKKMNEIERSTYLSAESRRYAAGNPFRVMQLAILKLARTLSPVPLSAEFGSRKLYVAAAGLYAVPLDLLILLGLWRGAIPRGGKFFLMLPALYFTAVHAMSVGSLRYRMPAEVPMAVVAASIAARASGLSRQSLVSRTHPGANPSVDAGTGTPGSAAAPGSSG